MIKLIRSMINNRAISLVLVVLIAMSGVLAYYYLPRQENPDVSFPVAMIITPYPGASAADVQELVLKKIEDQFSEVKNVDDITGTAKSGMGITVVQFTDKADNDRAMQDVRNAMLDVQSKLPSGALDSVIDTDIISTAGILISLSGESYTYQQLASFGDQFKKQLSNIDGITKFEIEGELEKEVRIDVDINKLNAVGLSIEDVNKILSARNVEIPPGSIKGGGTRITVEATGSFAEIDDIRNTVLFVSRTSGITLRLRDIADVHISVEEDTEKFLQNGNNTVLLTGFFEEGKNIVIVGREVREALDQVKRTLPEDLIVEEVVYQPEDVSTSVNDFMANLLVGVLLVVIVVFFGMGARNAIVVSTAIPLSILITFSAMYAMDIYIHQMSLTALIIALGILVDNAIVISDGIQVNINNGQDNLNGSIDAVNKAAIPVFTATLTTIAAISPLMGMPGGAGEFLISIPLVLIISVVASYLVAMIVMPVLGEWIFRAAKPKKANRRNIMRETFEKLLDLGLKFRAITIVSIFVIFYLVMTQITPQLPSEFFPFVEKDLMYIDITNELQGDIQSTEVLANQVVEILSEDPEITSYTVSIGNGMPKFYISMPVATPSSDYAQMVLKYNLETGDNPRFTDRKLFANYLQNKLETKIAGGTIKVNLLQNGPPSDAKIILRVSGDNFERLKEVTSSIEDEMRKIDGIVNIRDNIKPETLQYNVAINTEHATMLGLSNYDIQRQVNLALYGSIPTVFRKDGKEFNLNLKTDISSPEQLENFNIKSSVTGNKTLLKQYADVTYSTKVDTINRFNKEMTTTILADPAPGYDSATLTGLVETVAVPTANTVGARITFAGEREDIAENFGVIGQLAVFAIALIYIILMVQFKSFTQPIVILMTIPLSLIGSIIGLFLLNQPLSLTAFLGIIALIGLVVKNGILLIEYINEAMDAGLPVNKACEDAVDKRFNAIILSAMTTVMGLFPLAIGGSSLFAPMAISLMAGLLVSTVLTMVVVPVMFSLLQDLLKKVSNKKSS